jgi:hypothetical protein
MLGYVMDKLIFSDEIILTFKKFTIYLSQVKLSFILFLCGMDFLASLQVFMIYFYLLVIFLFAIWGVIDILGDFRESNSSSGHFECFLFSNEKDLSK